MPLIFRVIYTYARCRCRLHGDTGQKFGDSVIKYLKQLEDVAHEKKNIFINQNERKIDMRTTSDQMEQSPLDPENVRSLKHTGSGVRGQSFSDGPFFSPLSCTYTV